MALNEPAKTRCKVGSYWLVVQTHFTRQKAFTIMSYPSGNRFYENVLYLYSAKVRQLPPDSEFAGFALRKWIIFINLKIR